MRTTIASTFAALLSAAVAATLGCGGGGLDGAAGPAAPRPTAPSAAGGRVELVSPAALQGVVGQALADPVRVRVVGTDGGAVRGVTVRFSAPGNGSVAPARATSDSAGFAVTTWTLGTAAGAQQLTAAVDGATPATATAQASPGAPAALDVVSGADQRAVAGCALAAPVVFRARDQYGNPTPGVPIAVVAEQGRVTAAEATTDSAGAARAAWTLGASAGGETQRLAARVAAAPAVAATAQARTAEMSPGGYATVGNRIVAADCAPTLFHGIARVGFEFDATGPFMPSAEELRVMASWGANVVRVPLTQDYWLPGAALYDPQYQARVDRYVQWAVAAGLTVMLDLHWSDCGDLAARKAAAPYPPVPCGPPGQREVRQQRMADRNSLTFWTQVATKYKDHPKVIFELYNEPHTVGFPVWLNGGPSGDGFEVAGMQQLYDAVRATGARNLVIANGLAGGYDLTGVAQHRIRGYNVVYGTHPYIYKSAAFPDDPFRRPGQWDRVFGALADTDPVMITEFTTLEQECGTDILTQTMDYAARKGMGWVYWGWYYASGADYTCLKDTPVVDLANTPSAKGRVIRDRLLALQRAGR